MEYPNIPTSVFRQNNQNMLVSIPREQYDMYMAKKHPNSDPESENEATLYYHAKYDPYPTRSSIVTRSMARNMEKKEALNKAFSVMNIPLIKQMQIKSYFDQEFPDRPNYYESEDSEGKFTRKRKKVARKRRNSVGPHLRTQWICETDGLHIKKKWRRRYSESSVAESDTENNDNQKPIEKPVVEIPTINKCKGKGIKNRRRSLSAVSKSDKENIVVGENCNVEKIKRRRYSESIGRLSQREVDLNRANCDNEPDDHLPRNSRKMKILDNSFETLCSVERQVSKKLHEVVVTTSASVNNNNNAQLNRGRTRKNEERQAINSKIKTNQPWFKIKLDSNKDKPKQQVEKKNSGKEEIKSTKYVTQAQIKNKSKCINLTAVQPKTIKQRRQSVYVPPTVLVEFFNEEKTSNNNKVCTPTKIDNLHANETIIIKPHAKPQRIRPRRHSEPNIPTFNKEMLDVTKGDQWQIFRDSLLYPENILQLMFTDEKENEKARKELINILETSSEASMDDTTRHGSYPDGSVPGNINNLFLAFKKYNKNNNPVLGSGNRITETQGSTRSSNVINQSTDSESEDVHSDNMTKMEHNYNFKKRFIHQHERPSTPLPAPYPTTEEDEDSRLPSSSASSCSSAYSNYCTTEKKKEEVTHPKVARKRTICRSQFRHENMEIYKLGNSIPTSLCKTKEPYNVCTEKNLQLCCQNQQNGKKIEENVQKESITESIINSIEGNKRKDITLWRPVPLNDEKDGKQNIDSNVNVKDNTKPLGTGRHILPAVIPRTPIRRRNTISDENKRKNSMDEKVDQLNKGQDKEIDEPVIGKASPVSINTLKSITGRRKTAIGNEHVYNRDGNSVDCKKLKKYSKKRRHSTMVEWTPLEGSSSSNSCSNSPLNLSLKNNLYSKPTTGNLSNPYNDPRLKPKSKELHHPFVAIQQNNIQREGNCVAAPSTLTNTANTNKPVDISFPEIEQQISRLVKPDIHVNRILPGKENNSLESTIPESLSSELRKAKSVNLFQCDTLENLNQENLKVAHAAQSNLQFGGEPDVRDRYEKNITARQMEKRTQPQRNIENIMVAESSKPGIRGRKAKSIRPTKNVENQKQEHLEVKNINPGIRYLRARKAKSVPPKQMEIQTQQIRVENISKPGLQLEQSSDTDTRDRGKSIAPKQIEENLAQHELRVENNTQKDLKFEKSSKPNIEHSHAKSITSKQIMELQTQSHMNMENITQLQFAKSSKTVEDISQQDLRFEKSIIPDIRYHNNLQIEHRIDKENIQENISQKGGPEEKVAKVQSRIISETTIQTKSLVHSPTDNLPTINDDEVVRSILQLVMSTMEPNFTIEIWLVLNKWYLELHQYLLQPNISKNLKTAILKTFNEVLMYIAQKLFDMSLAEVNSKVLLYSFIDKMMSYDLVPCKELIITFLPKLRSKENVEEHTRSLLTSVEKIITSKKGRTLSKAKTRPSVQDSVSPAPSIYSVGQNCIRKSKAFARHKHNPPSTRLEYNKSNMHRPPTNRMINVEDVEQTGVRRITPFQELTVVGPQRIDPNKPPYLLPYANTPNVTNETNPIANGLVEKCNRPNALQPNDSTIIEAGIVNMPQNISNISAGSQVENNSLIRTETYTDNRCVPPNAIEICPDKILITNIKDVHEVDVNGQNKGTVAPDTGDVLKVAHITEPSQKEIETNSGEIVTKSCSEADVEQFLQTNVIFNESRVSIPNQDCDKPRTIENNSISLESSIENINASKNDNKQIDNESVEQEATRECKTKPRGHINIISNTVIVRDKTMEITRGISSQDSPYDITTEDNTQCSDEVLVEKVRASEKPVSIASISISASDGITPKELFQIKNGITFEKPDTIFKCIKQSLENVRNMDISDKDLPDISVQILSDMPKPKMSPPKLIKLLPLKRTNSQCQEYRKKLRTMSSVSSNDEIIVIDDADDSVFLDIENNPDCNQNYISQEKSVTPAVLSPETTTKVDENDPTKSTTEQRNSSCTTPNDKQKVMASDIIEISESPDKPRHKSQEVTRTPVLETFSSGQEFLKPFRVYSTYGEKLRGDVERVLISSEVSHCTLIDDNVEVIRATNCPFIKKPLVYTRPVLPHEVKKYSPKEMTLGISEFFKKQRTRDTSRERQLLSNIAQFEEDDRFLRCRLKVKSTSELTQTPSRTMDFPGSPSVRRLSVARDPQLSPLDLDDVRYSVGKPSRTSLTQNLNLQAHPNRSTPLSPVVPLLPVFPESHDSRANWKNWFTEDHRRCVLNFSRSHSNGGTGRSRNLSRRESVETVSSIGSDSCARFPTEQDCCNVEIDSTVYRLKRTVCEKIPKGKLCYIRESNTFIRYFDDNQIELFLRNFEGNLAASDILKQIKGRTASLSNADMSLGHNESSGKSEVITLSKDISFSSEDFFSDPEQYVEEVEKVEHFVPKDFYGFYKFVTGYQIVQSHPPISFQTFLATHNTNGLRVLLKNYVYTLLAEYDARL